MKFILLIMVYISFYSCTKHNLIIPTQRNCYGDFTQKVINHDTSFIMGCPVMFNTIPLHKYNYDRPVFNPDNYYQIAYTRDNTESTTGTWNTELWTFDFCTQETKFLTDKVGYGIDWSTKGWLIFTGKDKQIWKIKSDGDSLTQLTNQSGYNNYPVWNDEGTHFIYKHGTQHIYIANEEGEINDTLDNIAAGRWNWTHRFLTYTSGDGNGNRVIKVRDFDSNIDEIVDTFPPDSSINFLFNGISYPVGDNLVFWNSHKFIGCSNIKTNERKILLEGATNRKYLIMDISPNDKTIIVSRGNSNKINDCLIEHETSLYLIDIDGRNERRINIPE